MAQRSYHPLAKVAFAAAAILTLLTLTMHGRRAVGNLNSSGTQPETHLRTETFQFPAPQQ
jgi:hypothetical protein